MVNIGFTISSVSAKTRILVTTVAIAISATVSPAAGSNDAPPETNNEPGPPELALEPGIWEGRLECGRGTSYVTLSADIHPYNSNPKHTAGRMDFADSPGGPPFARGQALINFFGGKAMLSLRPWIFRPMDSESFAGDYPGAELTVTMDRQSMSAPTFGGCQDLQLKRMPDFRASGGIESATDLPPTFEGTLSCTNGQATWHLRLQLQPSGKTDFDGQVLLQPVADPSRSALASYQVFGEIDPATAELTIIGDRWNRKSRQLRNMLDFSGLIRQNGQRFVGEGPVALGPCRTVDLHVPGGDQMTQIRMPSPALPPEEWDTPSACATLINWARQSLIESGGKSVYTSFTSSRVHEIGIGLFADERFVPYFTVPFAELSAEQRKQVLDVAQACRFQTYSSTEIYESGAMSFTSGFFPDSASGEWLKLKRFRMLRKRLGNEMAKLEPEPVSETDITSLEASMAELPERFSGLWQSDLAAARALLTSKIDTAKGLMVQRLATEIGALPLAWPAFAEGRMIRKEIPALGDDRARDQAMLITKLDSRLSLAADAVLLQISEQFAGREPSLNSLQDIRQRLDFAWGEIGLYVATDGPGFKAVNKIIATQAKLVLPAFKDKTRKMIDSRAHFDTRTAQHDGAMRFYFQLRPSSDLFAGAFVAYEKYVEELRPVPTLADLVEDDGSPTAFGLREAVASNAQSFWDISSSLLPLNLSSLFQNSIRVSSVKKRDCSEAPKGGYWCNYNISFSGSLGSAANLAVSGEVLRARLELSGLAWRVVELPPKPPPKYDPYAGGQRSTVPLACDPFSEICF